MSNLPRPEYLIMLTYVITTLTEKSSHIDSLSQSLVFAELALQIYTGVQNHVSVSVMQIKN